MKFMVKLDYNGIKQETEFDIDDPEAFRKRVSEWMANFPKVMQLDVLPFERPTSKRASSPTSSSAPTSSPSTPGGAK